MKTIRPGRIRRNSKQLAMPPTRRRGLSTHIMPPELKRKPSGADSAINFADGMVNRAEMKAKEAALIPQNMFTAAKQLRNCKSIDSTSRNVLRAAIVFASYRPDKSSHGLVCVGVEMLATEMGVTPETARRHRKKVELAGLIRVIDPGGGRHRAMVFVINWDEIEARTSMEKPPRQSQGKRGGNPVTHARESQLKPPSLRTDTPACDPRYPIAGAGASYNSKIHTTNQVGDGGDLLVDSMDPEEFEEAVHIARGIGHTNPSDFVRRAGALPRVAYLAEQTQSAKNQGGAAEARLKNDEQPPEDWLQRWIRIRKSKGIEQEAKQRELQDRFEFVRGLPADQLDRLVESRVCDFNHPAVINQPACAERLSRVHAEGRLFDEDQEAQMALNSLLSMGSGLQTLKRRVRNENRQSALCRKVSDRSSEAVEGERPRRGLRNRHNAPRKAADHG